jgi:diguanylate cyclase (GGDEF)-like protein
MSHDEQGATRSRTAEEERDWLITVLQAQGELQDLFIRTGADRAWWDTALRKVLALSQSEFGFLGRIDRDADGSPYLLSLAITDIAWNDWSRQVFDQFAADGLEFRNADSLFGVTVNTGELVVSDDPATDPRRCGLPPGHPPLMSYMGIPLREGDEPIGMVGIANRPGGYTPDMESDLKPVLSVLATMIARDVAARHAVDLGRTVETLTRVEGERQVTDRAVQDALAADSLGAAAGIVTDALSGMQPGMRVCLLAGDGPDVEWLRRLSGEGDALARADCMALQSGRMHVSVPGIRLGTCAHADPMDAITICCPVSTDDDEYGLLVAAARDVVGEDVSTRAAIIGQSAERLAGALAQVALRESISSRALRDPLTGLPNRTGLLQAVERRLARIEAAARPFGVMIVDLDDFKDVNDQLGHAEGDRVLVAVANALAAHVREGDFVARIGGDEFVVVLSSGDPDAMRVAGRRLIDAVSMVAPGGGPTTSASAGGVPVGWGDVTWDAAYQQADMLLYEAKAAGKNQVAIGPVLGTPEQA